MDTDCFLPFNNLSEQTATNLLAAYEHIELMFAKAVWLAKAKGIDPNDDFKGLYISEGHIDTLLQHRLGSGAWSFKDEPTLAQIDEAIHITRQQWHSTFKEVFHPFFHLQRAFALSNDELDLLLLVYAPEFDPRYERLYAFVQDDVTKKRPSINLLLDLISNNFAEKLHKRQLFFKNGRLLKNQLLQLVSESNSSFLTQSLHPQQAVTNYILGLPILENEPATIYQLQQASQITHVERVLPTTLEKIKSVFQAQISQPLLSFVGERGVGKAEAASWVAATVKTPLLRVDLTAVSEPDSLFFDTLLRNGRLTQATLFIQGWHHTFKQALPKPAIWQSLLAYPHIIIISSQQSWQPSQHLHQRPIYTIQFATATYETRLHTWQTHLGQNGASAHLNLPFLAAQFRFTPSQIEDSVATAVNLAHFKQAPLSTTELMEASRAHSNQKLATLATKLIPRYRWTDIVLPTDTLNQLQELTARLKYQNIVFDQWGFGQKMAYGKGLAALFVGESGTGKTMSADIIAHELELDLYKIDLSSLVSKFIGETEKNLEQIFVEASTSNAILFFDEADAIFGKRSEVKDSHDRYANLEVSYLLQRIEQFEGIVILASNLHSNIDKAFTRRLDFIIKFPFPQKEEREQIWRVSTPAQLPKSNDILYATLAEQFDLAGGNIRNVVLRAAFLAAKANKPLEMGHLLLATKREYQKLGRFINESLFETEA